MAKQRSVLIVDSELFRHSPLVLHHLVCLSLSRYANDDRVDIGIREFACDHAGDPSANEKATRFDDSHESSPSRLYCTMSGGVRNNVGSALFGDRMERYFCQYHISRYFIYGISLVHIYIVIFADSRQRFLKSIQLFIVNISIYLLKTR